MSGPSVELHLGDCLDWLPTIPDASVDAVITDPPFFGVRRESWDKQWPTPAEFIDWLGRVADQWRRVLKPSGSLYVFASPRMAARVEIMIAERFHVLNAITWQKDFPCGALKYGAENFRGFVEMSERIIFAEQLVGGHGALGAKIREARLAARLSCNDLDALTRPAGKRTGLTYRWEHPFSRGCIPSSRQYVAALQACGDVRPAMEIEAEYAALRRPFYAREDRPHTDMWTFKPVPQARLHHPCEKPVDLVAHAIESSTNAGDMVLDSFAGAGSVGVACMLTGRNFCGCEMDAAYHEIAQRRISRWFQSASKPDERNPRPLSGQLPLFAEDVA